MADNKTTPTKQPRKPKGVIRIRVNHLGLGQLDGSGNGKFCKQESDNLLNNIGTIISRNNTSEYSTTIGHGEEVIRNV